jgi:hypothetical protein
MPSDDSARWEPVEGVDVEAYARASALLLKHEAVDAAALLSTVGLTAEAWARVRAVWGGRIERYDDVRAAYVDSYRGATT